MSPEFIAGIPAIDSKIPFETLAFRGIELFLKGKNLSFGLPSVKSEWVSENGRIVGIDQEDYFYFVRNKWFRKRLFKIPRKVDTEENFRYQHNGGDLVVDLVAWLPGGQYVLLRHKTHGVFIVEPTSGKCGLLTLYQARAFGWKKELI